MSNSDLVPFGAAIAGDVLAAFKLPGGNTLVKAADAWLAKKRKDAAEILINEISNGYHGQITFEEHDVDPLIEIILRFSKAVADGAARENLLLLAQVIAGSKKNKALDGDKFRKWCGILEHLTRDELLVIGTSYSIRKGMADFAVQNDFWKQLAPALVEAGYESEIWALCASVSRTGLLVPSTSHTLATIGTFYVPSPWLVDLGTLADLEAVRNKASPNG
jgi:hypothetical protein